MKIVINNCYGGFLLSDKAKEMIMKRKGLNCFRYKQTKFKISDGVTEFVKIESVNDRVVLMTIDYLTRDLGEKVNEIPDDAIWSSSGINRDDIDLVAVVESLGREASANLSNLVVVEIPDDVNWVIEDYDGLESIHEAHRVWTA